MSEMESSVRSNYLQDIYYLDEDVYGKIFQNENISIQELIEMKRILSERKTKDETVKSLKLNTKGGIQSGCQETFKLNFNKLTISNEEQIGEIKIGPKVVSCDINVIKTLKTLLKTGITPDEELAEACRALSTSVFLLIQHNTFITTKQMMERLNPKSSYEKKLVEVIKEMVE